MDWTDERWVKLYTRDTTDWLALSWQAQGLFVLILRKVNRAGVIDLGRAGKRGLAAHIGGGSAWASLEPHLDELLADGCVTFDGIALRVPNFVTAQTSIQSDKARKRAERERATDLGRDEQENEEPKRDVTKRDGESQDVTGSRIDVTRGHDASRDVTNREIRGEETRVGIQSPAPPEAPTTEPPKAPPPNPGETGALFDDPAAKAPPPAKPAPKRRAPSKPKNEDPPPFSIEAAIDAIATAAGPRFEVGDKAAWDKGHIIATRKNIRRFADLSTWTLVGEWLRAGGDKFRGPVTIEWTAESHFSTAVMLAKRWHADGRPAIDRNGAAPEPTPEQRRAALVAGADQRPTSTGYSEPPPRDYDPTAPEIITDAERARREYARTAGRAALAALRNPGAKVVNS